MSEKLKFCSYCGQKMEDYEVHNNQYESTFHYGSKHDGDRIKYALCSDCVDKLTDAFVKGCMIEPEFIEPDSGYEVVFIPAWGEQRTEDCEYQ